MSHAAKTGAALEAIRQRLPEIQAWQAEGVSLRKISRRLDIPDSSFRGALKRVMAEALEPTEVHLDIPAQKATVSTRVYEGIPSSQPEAVRVVMEEARSLLPTLRDMVQEWGVMQAMIHEYTQRQKLLQVSPAYQPYDGFYSCRLNNRLIQDIKAYAAENRLSQSELITLAVQAYLGQHT
jgi:hypothetical protein